MPDNYIKLKLTNVRNNYQFKINDKGGTFWSINKFN